MLRLFDSSPIAPVRPLAGILAGVAALGLATSAVASTPASGNRPRAGSIKPPRTLLTERLAAEGRLGVSFAACAEVEASLGRVLYVNVDGFGVTGIGETGSGLPTDGHAAGELTPAPGEAIHPAYVELVRELGIGAVLPHFGRDDFSSVRRATTALRAASAEPLVLGVDYVDLRSEGAPAGARQRLGLGFGQGFAAECARFEPGCFGALAELEAWLHRASGLNQALGPTVDEPESRGALAPERAARRRGCAELAIAAYHRAGVGTVTKHFPYTPGSYDLHRHVEASRLAPAEIERRLELFRPEPGAPVSDTVMTTHLYHPAVDPDDLATFSEAWLGRLRRELGFEGLLLTDGLFMIRRYDATMRRMVARWPDEGGAARVTDPDSIFAARALLAGHDQAMLEGTAADTRRVFRNLHALSCQGTPTGSRLRARVLESAARVRAWKERRRAALTAGADVPPALVARALGTAAELRARAGTRGAAPVSCGAGDALSRVLGEFRALGLPPLDGGR